MAPIVNGVVRKFFNGKELVTKIVGNQTSRQVFSQEGNLLTTALKKIENYVIPASTPERRKIGFVAEAAKPAEETVKEIRTITKNIFDSQQKKSTARIVETLCVDGEKVGESVKISESFSGDPMSAMEDLRKGTYKKILRYFRGGQLEKETITVVEYRKRVSRTISDCAAVRKLEAKRSELNSKEKELLSEIRKLGEDKELIKMEKSLHEDERRLVYLERILDAQLSKFYYDPYDCRRITEKELQIPREQLEEKIKQIEEMIVKKKAKYAELVRKLGIKDKEEQLRQIRTESQDLYTQLAKQKEQNRAIVDFNGSYLVAKIDGEKFSLTV